jgi:hypothetical protein
MTQLHRKTTDERPHAAAADAPSERERQMAEFCIGYDGRRYHYNGYRYDKLEDVVAYASLTRSRPGPFDAGGPHTRGETFAPPSDAERSLMASLSIRFDDGAYRYEGFRYDGLTDAVNYAKRQRDDRS